MKLYLVLSTASAFLGAARSVGLLLATEAAHVLMYAPLEDTLS